MSYAHPPSSLPRTMTPQAMKQLGKGIGRGSAPPAAQTNGAGQAPGLQIQPNNMFQKAVQNAQKPIQAYQAEQKKGAAYIPGLTKTNEDEENFGPINPYQPGFCAPKDVPPELIEEFLHGEKNPISALMEYAAMTKLTVSFEEATVSGFQRTT